MAYRGRITDAQSALTDDEILALMPISYVFLAQLIGIEDALNLIEEYGGTQLYIPSKHSLNLKHDIASKVSYKNFLLIAEHCGGTYIEIPNGHAISIAMRNNIIKEQYKSKSKSRLARDFGLTVRQIRSILSSKKEIQPRIDKNLSLFE